MTTLAWTFVVENCQSEGGERQSEVQRIAQYSKALCVALVISLVAAAQRTLDVAPFLGCPDVFRRQTYGIAV